MYEWLLEYRDLVQDIDYLEHKLERNEVEVKRWIEGDLEGVPLRRESIAANLEEIIEKIKQEIAFKHRQRDKLIQLVEKFEGLEHRILKLKYVDGYTLEAIALKLNYSASHIKKKHAELIRLIRFVDSEGII